MRYVDLRISNLSRIFRPNQQDETVVGKAFSVYTIVDTFSNKICIDNCVDTESFTNYCFVLLIWSGNTRKIRNS